MASPMMIWRNNDGGAADDDDELIFSSFFKFLYICVQPYQSIVEMYEISGYVN
ncbi:hypothetical protein KSS87_008284 [Heliosperma pusillum]|nr:hypothetical protein KSS87_008284 [Heliosperma pusillum]